MWTEGTVGMDGKGVVYQIVCAEVCTPWCSAQRVQRAALALCCNSMTTCMVTRCMATTTWTHAPASRGRMQTSLAPCCMTMAMWAHVP